MGNSASTKKFTVDVGQYQLNKQIESRIQNDRRIMKNQKKILLLGAAEAGKSTVLKQMRILHTDGFNKTEINYQKLVIHSNMLQSMTAMIQAMPFLGIGFHDSSSVVYAGFIVRCNEESIGDLIFSAEIQFALKKLWQDGGIQQACRRASEYQLHDSTKYFFQNLDRLGLEHFVPTTQDILMARMRTTGIVQLHFMLKNIELKVVDVGGQRSERKKWIHCFDDVNSIIFIASLSEYDQKIAEDEKTNRVEESMRLFSFTANNDYFIKTPIMLFLNKKDLFEEKLKRVPLTLCFPDYQGRSNYVDGAAFMRTKFCSLRLGSSGSLYTHETCATDTNQVKFVLDACFHIIVTQNISNTCMS